MDEEKRAKLRRLRAAAAARRQQDADAEAIVSKILNGAELESSKSPKTTGDHQSFSRTAPPTPSTKDVARPSSSLGGKVDTHNRDPLPQQKAIREMHSDSIAFRTKDVARPPPSLRNNIDTRNPSSLPQQTAMHSGSTALRTLDAIAMEKEIILQAETKDAPVQLPSNETIHVQETAEDLMIDADERDRLAFKKRQDDVRRYRELAARVEEKRRLEDAAKAQTKKDDADAELEMLLAAELESPTNEDGAPTRKATDVVDEDAIAKPRKVLKPKSAKKAFELNALLDALPTMAATSSGGDHIQPKFATTSTYVLPTERLLPKAIAGTDAKETKTEFPIRQLPSNSPFNDPDLTLDGAAQNILMCLKAADDATSSWILMGEEHFSEDLQNEEDLTQQIEGLSRSLISTAYFLARGREGWKLLEFPQPFLDEAIDVLPNLINHLRYLTRYNVGWRLSRALEVTIKIDYRLTGIRRAKMATEDKMA